MKMEIKIFSSSIIFNPYLMKRVLVAYYNEEYVNPDCFTSLLTAITQNSYQRLLVIHEKKNTPKFKI